MHLHFAGIYEVESNTGQPDAKTGLSFKKINRVGPCRNSAKHNFFGPGQPGTSFVEIKIGLALIFFSFAGLYFEGQCIAYKLCLASLMKTS